jgi:hypothetical protein
MIHEVYSALAQHIRNRIPTLSNEGRVDWYLKQYSLEQPEDGMMCATPGCLIEFLPMEWKSKGASKLQEAQVRFVTHLVTETGYETDKRVLSGDHYAYDLDIFRALEGMRIYRRHIPGQESLGGTDADWLVAETITRVAQDTDHELSRVLVSRTTWSMKVYDYRAMKEYIEVMVTPAVSAVIVDTP